MYRIFTLLCFLLCFINTIQAQERLVISPEMVYNISARGNEWVLFDNQQITPGTYACEIPQTDNQWVYYDASFNWRTFVYPVSVVIDLGYSQNITQLCLLDASEPGGVVSVYSGDPLNWNPILQHGNTSNDCYPLALNTRYLKFTFNAVIARVREIELYGDVANSIACPPAVNICEVANDCQCDRPDMHGFIGSNFNIDVPPALTNAVGFVRSYQQEFLNWGWDDANYAGYPNDQYTFGPTKSPEYDHDFLYQGVKDHGVGIGAAMHHAPPSLVTFDYFGNPPGFNAIIPYNNDVIDVFTFIHTIHRKPFNESLYPIVPDLVVDDPTAYIEYADMFYQFSARYGFPGTTQNLKLDPSNQPKSGLDLVQYVENWNEPDKWWHYFWVDGLDYLDPAIEEELGYFSPYEYAAMSCAEYDGNGSTNGVENVIIDRFGNDIPAGAGPVGLQAANGNMKMVMAGLSEVNLNYVRAIKFWFDHHRPDIDFPFDVINFHEYSNDALNDAPLGTHAISPEADDLRGQMEEVVDYRNRYLPGVEVWLSEFGYDTNPNSPQSADCSLYCNDCNSPECLEKFREIQGQWNVRAFLELAAAGVDRAQVFNMRDDSPENSWGLYETSGLATYMGDNYKPKNSWYYISTLKNATLGLRYDPGYVHSDPNVRVYRFVDDCNNPEKTVYAIWSPTSMHGDQTPVITDYTLPFITGSATLIELADEDIDGIRQELTPDCNGQICVDVSESPIFIVEGILPEDQIGCNCNYLNYTTDNPNANALRDEELFIGSPYCNEGNDLSSFWSANAQNEVILDLGVEHKINNLFLHSQDSTEAYLEIYTGSAGNWILLDTWNMYNPTPFKWKSYTNLNITSKLVRIRALNNNIRLHEVVICGEDVCETGDPDYYFIDMESCDPTDVGVIEEIFINQSGCDSIITTTTTLLPTSYKYFYVDSCDPNEEGIDTLILTNQFGCDSLNITITSLLPSDQTMAAAESCDPNDVGIETVVLINQFGCDSIVTINTSLLPSSETFLDLESCDPNLEGLDTIILTNQFGCDSVVISNTSLLPSDDLLINLESCHIIDVGTDVVVLTNQFGCDSTITTVTSLLTIDQTISMEMTCDIDSIGADTMILINQFGCDSLIITQTSLINPTTTYIDLESCDPNLEGLDTIVLQNMNGCDSIIISNTSLLLSDTTQLFAQTCDPNQVGSSSDTLTNENGCDSIIILTNSLLSSDTTYFDAFTCNLMEVGTLIDTLTNQYGCDSFITTQTLLNPYDTIYISGYTCDENELWTITTDTVPGQGDCETIVLTEINSLLPNVNVYNTVDICEGTDIVVGSSIYDQTGIYEDTLLTSNNCDSIITTDLTVNTNYNITIDSMILFGEPFENDTSIIEQLSSIVGCDSIVQTNYIVQDPDAINDIFGLDNISLYPNPASDQFILDLTLSKKMDLTIDMYNVLGQHIKSILPTEKLSNGAYKYEENVRDLSDGTYFITIRSKEEVKLLKFIVAKI